MPRLHSVPTPCFYGVWGIAIPTSLCIMFFAGFSSYSNIICTHVAKSQLVSRFSYTKHVHIERQKEENVQNLARLDPAMNAVEIVYCNLWCIFVRYLFHWFFIVQYMQYNNV